MQVETNIDEADIGFVSDGQQANFTVDAYPGETFVGTVTRVRKKPQETQNVVTYTVVISAVNNDFRLLPGMTASVEVKISDRKDVIKIPNSALRFMPSSVEKHKAYKARSGRSGAGPPPPSVAKRRAEVLARFKRLSQQLNFTDTQRKFASDQMKRMGQRIRAMRQSGSQGQELVAIIKQMRKKNRQKLMEILSSEQRKKFKTIIANQLKNPTTPGRVWFLKDGKLRQVGIMLGVGDGKYNELSRGELEEGYEVIVGENRKSSGS